MNLSIQQAKSWQQLEAYKHEDLCQRFAEKYDMTKTDAEKVFEETKRFLFVAMLSEEPSSPSRLVDEMWHEFITYTEHYYSFCTYFNGRLIHHCPSDKPELDGYIRTKAKAEGLFGALEPKAWPEPDQAAKLVGKCSCSNHGCTCNCSNNIHKPLDPIMRLEPVFHI